MYLLGLEEIGEAISDLIDFIQTIIDMIGKLFKSYYLFIVFKSTISLFKIVFCTVIRVLI